MRILPMLTLALVFCPILANAQQGPVGPAPSFLFQMTGKLGNGQPIADSIVRRSTQFETAMSVGGGLLGAGAAYWLLSQEFHSSPCPDVDASCPAEHLPGGWQLAGTLVGGTAGYLLGRGLSGRWAADQPRMLSPGSRVPRQDLGMKGWEGAALGVLLGGVAMPIVVHSMKWDEQGDGVPAVAFAPLGALIGLVVGGSVADER